MSGVGEGVAVQVRVLPASASLSPGVKVMSHHTCLQLKFLCLIAVRATPGSWSLGDIVQIPKVKVTLFLELGMCPLLL